jgi:hypothetical protein
MSIGLRTIGIGMVIAAVGALFVGWRHRTASLATIDQAEARLEEGI